MAVSALSVATPLVVQANTTVNATQLSIQVAPITISGTKLGAEATAAGSGLTSTGMLPSINAADGSITAGSAMTAAADSTFSFISAARSADTAATSNSLSTDLVPTTTFGDQSGTYTTSTGSAGTIALDGDGAPAFGAVTKSGVTTTAIFSTTTSTDLGEALVRRIATASTDQATFTARRQGTSYGFSGSGLTAVTGGGVVSSAAAGDASTVTGQVGGNTQAGVAYSSTETLLLGQDSAGLTASTTDVTQPGYGIVTNSLGGTSAGSISGTTINALGVAAGAAGSTSTLSVVQSYTAF